MTPLATEVKQQAVQSGEEDHAANIKVRSSVKASWGDQDSLNEFRLELKRRMFDAVLTRWKESQEADHRMRQRYGTIIIVALAIQLISINLYAWRLGKGLLPGADPITSRILIVSVFVEVAGLVLAIIRYLFPRTGNDLNALLEHASQVE